VSPKAGTEIIVRSGDELKVVLPQVGVDIELFEGWEFDHFFIQPLDDENQGANTASAIEISEKKSLWQVSLQTHKIMGVR
jgi:organic radical activating enzyme